METTMETQLRQWTDDIDPASIPDEVIMSERGKRNARKRETYTGGIYWVNHNPDVNNCRCHKCMTKRHAPAFKARKGKK